MCATVDGVVHVVWTRDPEADAEAGSQIQYVRSEDAGRTWSEPIALSSSPKDARNPSIGCTSASLVVAWEDTRVGEIDAESIFVSSSPDQGLTWTPEVAVDFDTLGLSRSLEPQVAVSQKDAYVVWFDGVSGAFDIYTATSGVGGVPSGGDDVSTAWRRPVRIDGGNQGGAYSAHARVAAEPGGKAYVTWEDSRNGLSDIYFSASSDGGLTFSEDVRLDKGDTAGSYNSFSPTITAEKERIAVAWHDERSGAGRDVMLNVSLDGGASFKDEALRVDTDTPGLSDSILPSLVLRDGVVHVAWQDARSGGYDIYYRSWSAGFDADEVRLDTNGAGFGNSIEPVVAVAPDHVVVGWSDYRDDADGLGYDDLYYAFSGDGGATWPDDDLRFDNVAKGSKYTEDLNLAVVGNTLLAAWTDGRFGSPDILFHRLDVGTEAAYLEADAAE
jgi:hypothetical protein